MKENILEQAYEKELDFILQQGESLKIEFKEGLGRIDEDIVAFANAEGGRIFLGVSDDGKIKGINITNKLKSGIQNIARNCDPSVKVELEEVSSVLVINVVEGKDKPYKCKDGFFMRIGTNSQKISRDEILELIITVNKKTFDSLINKEFDFKKDFDRRKFLEYLKRAKIGHVLQRNELLESFGVLKENRMNNAGVLLFAKEPQKFFPQSVYTVVVYRNIEGTDIIQRKEITGSLVEIVERVMEFVEFYIKVAYKFTGKPQRENIYEYPIEAIREAVINSVMHKDYFESGHNNILAIFPDRIEIEDCWIRPRNFILGKTKFRRNPIITDLFFRIEFGEKIGSGIKRMKKICSDENAPAPVIDAQKNYFYVTFKQNPEYLRIGGTTPKTTLKTTPKDKILAFIKQNPYITKEEIAKQLNITIDGVKYHIKKLRKEKIIKWRGPSKGGYWEIAEKSVNKKV